ncbi:MAG: hypothetical protein Fur0046_27800 [Cyanobacteria bacterium J069]
MNPESRPSNLVPAPPAPRRPVTPAPAAAPPYAPPRAPLSRWRFWLPLAIQAALIAVIPLQASYTQATGRTVILQTGPVDPYHPLRGYYVTLGYDISRPGELEKLPGWKEVEATAQQRRSLFASSPALYVILAAPETEDSQPPKPWKAVAVSSDRPTNLPANQIALRGTYRSGWVNYGLEQYYMPEAERLDINNRIAEIQRVNLQTPEFVIEAKVGANGEAVPTGMWLRDRVYRF